MNPRLLQESFRLTLLFVAMLGVISYGFAQGRGHGGGSGKGQGSSSGNAGTPRAGPPSGAGVDRGVGTSSERSGGRADTGRGNVSEKSNARSDDGLNRARRAGENLRRADQDLRNHPGIASVVHLNANDLREQYQVALGNNPDLKFGQFVSATRIAQNLGGRFPGLTRDSILDGIASGKSLGRTLHDLGVNEHEASEAQKQAERELKRARKD